MTDAKPAKKVRSVKTISVSVDGYGTATFSNGTASGAFMDAYRAFLHAAPECTFREFLTRAYRLYMPNPPGVGEPIRVFGRNAWTLEPLRRGVTRFVYVDGGRAMSAHYSDIVRGHGEPACEAVE